MTKSTRTKLKPREPSAQLSAQLTRDTAVHEAGHAVVAEWLGIAVAHARIGVETPKPGAHIGRIGAVVYTDKTIDVKKGDHLLAVYCAGRVADSLLTSRTPEQIDHGCRADFGEIRRLLEQLTDVDVDDKVREAVEAGTKKATKVLETKSAQKAVNELADLLMAKRKVSGARVRQVVAKHRRRRR